MTSLISVVYIDRYSPSVISVHFTDRKQKIGAINCVFIIMTSLIFVLFIDIYTTWRPIITHTCVSLWCHWCLCSLLADTNWRPVITRIVHYDVNEICALRTPLWPVITYVCDDDVTEFCVLYLQRHDMAASTYRWLIPILTAFFSFNEIAFAIVSASICCCCAPLRTNRVRSRDLPRYCYCACGSHQPEMWTAVIVPRRPNTGSICPPVRLSVRQSDWNSLPSISWTFVGRFS